MVSLKTRFLFFFFRFVFIANLVSVGACSDIQSASSTLKQKLPTNSVSCQPIPQAQVKQFVHSYRKFKQQVETLEVDLHRQTWTDRGIIRIPLETAWIDTMLRRIDQKHWVTHSAGVSEDLQLETAFPPRIFKPLRSLKHKIQSIIDHREYGFEKHFQARHWKNQGVLTEKAQEIFGDESLAYPWHKDPRYASAIITIRGQKGTQYVDAHEASHFELAAENSTIPIIYRIKEGAKPKIKEAEIGELIILAGRHSETNGRHIIHRSPPDADPLGESDGRLILLLELI